MAGRITNSQLFSSSIGDHQDPDHVYYNMSIINGQTTDGADPDVVFTETRDSPIIRDASKYVFSIVRFDMNGPNKDLPLFMPRIQTGAGQTNPNLTVYSVTLKVAYNSTNIPNPPGAPISISGTLESSQTFIIHVPEYLDNSIAPVPSVPAGGILTQNVGTRYYWYSTYAKWLECVNNAYQTAWNDLNTQYKAAQTTAGIALANLVDLVSKPPYMTYNPADNLFTLYTDVWGYGDNGTGSTNRQSAGQQYDENWSLFFNSNMYGLFSNYKADYLNQPNGKTYQIMITNILYQNILVVTPPAPAAPITYWTTVQDYESTSSLWSPIGGIVFTSSLLPLTYEQSGEPVQFGDSNTGNLAPPQAAFIPIITDTALAQVSASSYREFFQYAPTAEYRLSNFVRSELPVQQIDVRVFWRNRLDGNLYPVQMYNSSSVQIKMLFRRRGIFSFPHPAQLGFNV